MKGQVIGVGRSCTLVVPSKKYFRFGGVNNGVSVHALTTSSRQREINKALNFHDSLHRAPITAAKASLNGEWLLTGCADSTIRVWRYDGNVLRLKATLSGHDGSNVRCIDVSTEFGIIASGCGLGKVILWDLRTLTFVRSIKPEVTQQPVHGVSINHSNGNILTLVGGQLNLFDVNGKTLGRHDPYAVNQPMCAVATDCPEWMDNGIVAVSGHLSGDVLFWSIDFDQKQLFVRHSLLDNPHSSVITALRVTSGQDTSDARTSSVLRTSGVERQDTLLVGDASGRISLCKVTELSSYSQSDLLEVASELEKSDN
jgi:WD40 repeat protein